MIAHLDAALAFAARGMAVFPLHGKVPAIPSTAGGRGCLDASTDTAVIRRWWRDRPYANIGIATGAASGVFVVDVDPRHGGDAELRRLSVERGLLPSTVTARTGGGLHLYFRHEPGVGNSAGRIGPGIDVRSDCGYVVAPPSVHPTGAMYRWAPGRGLDDLEIALAPGWLVEAARPPERAPGRGIPATCAALSPYGRAALCSAAEKILTAPNGEQEATLNGEAYAIGRLTGAGGLPAELALDILLTAALAIPSYQPGRPWRRAEIEAKVRRAFAEGAVLPRASREESDG